jgi:hypothetical protein
MSARTSARVSASKTIVEPLINCSPAGLPMLSGAIEYAPNSVARVVSEAITKYNQC